MVKTVILDCEKLLKKKQAHIYLAEVFDFPDYYGRNLDALFDCLTEMGECTILLKGEDAIRRTDCYGTKILKVLEEAVQTNSRLKLECS